MKTILKVLIAAVIALVGFSACSEPDAIDGLTGKYKEPQALSLTTIESLGKEVDNAGLRHFIVKLSGGSDNLVFEFVGNDYFLQSVIFTPATQEVAGKNSYILEKSSYNGSILTRGNIIVSSTDNENYVISGIVWASDGSIVDFSVEGVLKYEPDIVKIEPIVCSGSISTSPLYGTDTNVNWGPIERHYQNIITAIDAEHNVLARFDAYTDTQETLTGVYQVIGNTYAANIMNNGWAWEESFGGTILYSKGVAYYVTAGTITIEDNGDGLLLISSTDAVCADTKGNPGPVNFIYKMTKL